MIIAQWSVSKLWTVDVVLPAASATPGVPRKNSICDPAAPLDLAGLSDRMTVTSGKSRRKEEISLPKHQLPREAAIGPRSKIGKGLTGR